MIYSDPNNKLSHVPSNDERAAKAQLEQLRRTWQGFPMPVQLLLEEHLKRYGLEAAVDATHIARRMR